MFLEDNSLFLYAVAGDLGGSVDWNGVTDCDSVCDPLQNQMAERGIVPARISFYLFIYLFFAPDPLKHWVRLC